MTRERYESLVLARRFRRRRNPDVLILGVTVVAILVLTPGHGAVGWLVAFGLAVLIGALIRLLGRRYPAIHGQRRRRMRPR